MESVITAAVTGGLALVGVIITNISSNRKIENQLTVQQAVTNEKIDNLKAEVEKHNSFATRMPALEEKVSGIEKRVSSLEKNS